MIQESLALDDLLMIPRFSDIESRKTIDVSNTLRNLFGLEIRLNTPIISSPMNTVTEDKMALAIHDNGGLGIIHRYCSIEQQVNMVKNTVFQSVSVINNQNQYQTHYNTCRQSNIGAAIRC